MKNQQSLNALPLADKFRTAGFRLAEDNLKASGAELAREVIHNVRERISSVDWDNLDPASNEVYDLFPVLVAVANTQKTGIHLFNQWELDDFSLRRFSIGESAPSAHVMQHLIVPLKEVVEKAIDRLEERLPKNGAPALHLTH